MNLDHLADEIVSGNVGITADQIFTDYMPADVSVAALVRVPLNGIPIDHTLPGYFKCKIQVIVRAQKHATGDAIARKIMNLLTTMQEKTYANPAMTIKQMLPETLPIVYPRSEGNGIEWSLNFATVYCDG